MSGSGSDIGIVTAASADGSLLALHAPTASSVGGSTRHTVRLYDATVSTRAANLRSTLVASVDAADGQVVELAFEDASNNSTSGPSFLAARLSSDPNTGRPDKVIVWDLLRGVVGSVLTSPPSTTYHGLSLNNGKLYALSVSGETGRVAVLVYDISAEGGGRLKRKIKCPSLDGDEAKSIRLGLAVSGNNTNADNSGAEGGEGGVIVAVRIGDVLRLLNGTNGKKLAKCKIRGDDSDDGGGTSSSPSSSTPVAFSSDGHLIATATATGLQIFDAAMGGKALYTVKCVQQLVADAAIRPIEGGKYAVLLTADEGTYLAECGGSAGKKGAKKHDKAATAAIDALATLRCASTGDNGDSRSIAAAAFHSASPGNRVMILSIGGGGAVEIDEVNYRDEDGAMVRGEVVVGRGAGDDEEDAGGSMDGDDAEKKRKRALPSGELVLGPGEAGGEAMGVSDGTTSKKRAKVATAADDNDAADNDDEDDEFVLLPDDDATEEAAGATIADRLALLTSEMERDGTDSDDSEEDEETVAALYGSGKKKRKATTESLSTLLRQALSSNDDGQLEVALHVRDKKVIENSIAALAREDEERAGEEDDNGGSGDDMITKLLGKLVDRLGRKPGRAEELSVWVQTVLLILISGKSMSRRERNVAAKLAPLRSMLNERVESLPHLLRLEGRLSLLGQQL